MIANGKYHFACSWSCRQIPRDLNLELTYPQSNSNKKWSNIVMLLQRFNQYIALTTATVSKQGLWPACDKDTFLYCDPCIITFMYLAQFPLYNKPGKIMVMKTLKTELFLWSKLLIIPHKQTHLGLVMLLINTMMYYRHA